MFSFQKAPASHKVLWLTSADHVAQLILIAVPAWFSLMLFITPDLFSTNAAYKVMHNQMDELHWMAFSFSVVLVSFLCWAASNIYMMIVQNTILMVWHGSVALCIFVAYPIGTGSGTYAILAFAATLRAINLCLRITNRH